MDKVSSIKDRIFSKKTNLSIEKAYYRNHHTLMKEYGWIPLEEYINLPQETVNNLIKEINHDRKEKNKQNKKLKNRRKR